MLAIQDCVVAPTLAVCHDILEEPGGFFLLVMEGVRGDLMRRLLVGGELLLEELRILRQHAARHLEDLAGAATVLVEDDRLDVVIALEPHQHVRIRAGPGEDRLLVVAYRKEISMRLGELLEKVVLHGVDVLELVDQEIVPAIRDQAGERLGLRDQLVEVDHVAVREPGAVLAKQPRLVGLQLVTVEPMPAEAVEHAATALRRHPQPAEYDGLVDLIGDAESSFEACGIGVLAQQREAQRVNRPARDRFGLVPQRLFEPPSDLLGGAIGECDGADAVRIDPGGDEMLDAGDETIRLPGTRAGDDQDRAEARFDGEALARQGIEAHRSFSLGSNVTSVTVRHAACHSFHDVIALLSILALATPSPKLVLDPGLLVRLQTLAAGLHNEIVLCLTGTTREGTAIATGFSMPDPRLSASDHATFGPCPKETVAIWHNHPLENRSGAMSDGAAGFARPRGDPNMTPRELCALSNTDIRTAAANDQPFIVVSVDRETWCWWSRDQVRNLAASNALRGDPMPGQIELRATH